MQANLLDEVRAELGKLGEPELKLLFGWLVRIWQYVIVGYEPTVPAMCYAPSRPLLGYLKLLTKEERTEIMRQLCDQLGHNYPEGITTSPTGLLQGEYVPREWPLVSQER